MLPAARRAFLPTPLKSSHVAPILFRLANTYGPYGREEWGKGFFAVSPPRLSPPRDAAALAEDGSSSTRDVIAQQLAGDVSLSSSSSSSTSAAGPVPPSNPYAPKQAAASTSLLGCKTLAESDSIRAEI